MTTTEKIKLYLRIDGNAEDELLGDMLAGAESYLRNAITNYAENYEASEYFRAQADQLKTILIAEQFYNRDGRNDARKDFSFVVRSMVNQLQYFSAGDTS